MRRSYLLIVTGLSLAISLPGCSPAPNYWTEAKANQKKILVSFPPLYAITHAIAKDDAYVLCMLTTDGPHGYDGAPTDLFKVNKADLFIYNGLSLDDEFVKRMMQNHKNRSLVTLDIGEVMDKKHHKYLIHMKAHDHKEDGHDHKHGEHDPHVWLGPPQAIVMTKIIAAKLGEVDPAKAADYTKRADEFIAKLKEVQDYGNAKFKDKENKKIVTTHDAFGYFAKAFKIKIVDTIQTKPGEDPDAAKMAELITKCQAEKVAVLAVEPQYSRGQAEALQLSLKQKGVEVTIVTLDPLETAGIPEGKKFNPDPDYYLKRMRDNIDTLAKALP